MSSAVNAARPDAPQSQGDEGGHLVRNTFVFVAAALLAVAYCSAVTVLKLVGRGQH